MLVKIGLQMEKCYTNVTLNANIGCFFRSNNVLYISVKGKNVFLYINI